MHKVTGAAFFFQEATVRTFLFKVELKIFNSIISSGIHVNASCNVSNLFCTQKDAMTNEEQIACHSFSDEDALAFV